MAMKNMNMEATMIMTLMRITDMMSGVTWSTAEATIGVSRAVLSVRRRCRCITTIPTMLTAAERRV